MRNNFGLLLTMASQAGCEIVNSEVAGSIPTAFCKRKKGISHAQEPAKPNQFKQRCEQYDHCKVTPIPKKSEVKLDTGKLIGVPDII